eukprot:TRINITY_DN25944_c0_g1_i1.p1 TRINITY_DN25944_c0_g1~~TRINITY_DN25944_c0_g1_i1.p1  ORF type:complete len:696 (+),score=93.28 TRINITY_DN25944_c0_g1_i1:161-2248(+)
MMLAFWPHVLAAALAGISAFPTATANATCNGSSGNRSNCTFRCSKNSECDPLSGRFGVCNDDGSCSVNCTARPPTCCETLIRREAVLACREFDSLTVSDAECQIFSDYAATRCKTECGNCTEIATEIRNQCMFLLQRKKFDFDTGLVYCDKLRDEFAVTRCPSACTEPIHMCFKEEADECMASCGNYDGCDCTQNRIGYGNLDTCFGQTVLKGPIPGTLGLEHSCKLYPEVCKSHRKAPKTNPLRHRCGLYRHCELNLCLVKNISCPAIDTCSGVGVCAPSNGLCYYQFKPDGEWCDDNLFYTHDDTCFGGKCIGKIDYCLRDSIRCINENPCLVPDGYCDGYTGHCVYDRLPDGTSCSSGLGVGLDGRCEGGICRRDYTDLCWNTTCAWRSQCLQNGTCDPTTGECMNAMMPEGSPCTDNNSETVDDMCLEGQCVGNFAIQSSFKKVSQDACSALHEGTGFRYYADVYDDAICMEQCVADPDCRIYSFSFHVCTIFSNLRKLEPDVLFWNRTWYGDTRSSKVTYAANCVMKSTTNDLFVDPYKDRKKTMFTVMFVFLVVSPSIFFLWLFKSKFVEWFTPANQAKHAKAEIDIYEATKVRRVSARESRVSWSSGVVAANPNAITDSDAEDATTADSKVHMLHIENDAKLKETPVIKDADITSYPTAAALGNGDSGVGGVGGGEGGVRDPRGEVSG